jgi:hypothetical protein
MKIVIRMTPQQEERALPILLRHSPGMIVQDGTYILSQEAVETLRNRGVKFTEVTRDEEPLTAAEVSAGERI